MGVAIGVILMLIALLAFPSEPQRHENSNASQHQAEFKTEHLDAPETLWQRTFEDPVAFYTLVLSIFTAVLAVVAIVQIRFLARADETAGISAEAARKSADVAEKILVDAERPYIFVFGVSYFKAVREQDGRLIPSIEYSVANYGKMPAIVDYVTVDFFFDDADELIFPETDWISDSQIVKSPVFRPGELRQKITCKLDRFDSIDSDDLSKITFAYFNIDHSGYPHRVPWASPQIPGKRTLKFKVVINYSGPFTKGHETSACWTYYQGSEVFSLEDKARNYRK
jgi:hypothetical protein